AKLAERGGRADTAGRTPRIQTGALGAGRLRASLPAGFNIRSFSLFLGRANKAMNVAMTNTADAIAPARLTRRGLILGGGSAFAWLASYPLLRRLWRPEAAVFIARDQRYDGPLEQTIRDGLVACGVEPTALAGKRV